VGSTLVTLNVGCRDFLSLSTTTHNRGVLSYSVYRARDTKLKREVAIKILPDEFLSDADRLSRFQREAKQGSPDRAIPRMFVEVFEIALNVKIPLI
jgi:serine/threonine protein kinase